MNPIYKIILAVVLCCNISISFSQREEITLKEDWKFALDEQANAEKPDYNDLKWQSITIPHDWAIYGPFNRNNDVQNVAITQNGETKATSKTGRTGGLPYVGIGWYRRLLNLDKFNSDSQQVVLLFDGAMSQAQVYVNGQEVCFWPYGYNSFWCDITPVLHKDGKNNIVAVRLKNLPLSSRWYPGAGLYRNVHLIVTDKTHIPVWGTYITTPHVEKDYATIKLQTEIANPTNAKLLLETRIINPQGKEVAKIISECSPANIGNTQNFVIENPQRWSPETPALYEAHSILFANSKQVDSYTTRFGIRSVEVIANKGFFLNGIKRQIKGVCLHHDLGPLGAAVNSSAIRHQLQMLKDMGCDAIRTTHNMPTPELVELCDEMGLMMLVEPFDEWNIAKCKNGYHRYFNEWAEKDMINMLHNYRNHPSIVLWSIGNEVPTQCEKDGYKVASFLQEICHREDPTRPVTCGMDQADCIINNGFGAILDIPGFNYRVNRYEEGYKKLPQGIILGSETASTVSSRGVYKFPVELKAGAEYKDHQCSSYDTEYCSWSNIPDVDFAAADNEPWNIGQFVWTGFDYLGEPTPYDTDAWPNHSSMFGIIDLASLPKDRYYLYRSIWNKDKPTLHMLPHWTWPGREGQVTPIFVYSSYPEVELFVNGKSMGKKTKNNASLLTRYRMIWDKVVYEPGEIKAVAYNADGEAVAAEIVKTAGKPHHLEVTVNNSPLHPDGEDLAYLTIRVVDKNGNLCPTDNRLVHFTVKGAGRYRASANGDPCNVDLYHLPQMHLFNGMLTAIVQAGKQAGTIQFKAFATGLASSVTNVIVSE